MKIQIIQSDEGLRLIKKHLPKILGIASIVIGDVASYLFVKKTIKVVETVKELKEEGKEQKDIIKAVAPDYILPTALLLGSNVLTVQSMILSEKQNIAAIATIGALSKEFTRYKATLPDDIREETELKIAKEDFTDSCWCVGNVSEHSSEYIAPSGEVIFYDPYRFDGGADAYFASTMIQFKQACLHLNRNFVLRGAADLNEFYRFMNIPETNYGEYASWQMCDGYQWIDIELTSIPVDKDVPVYRIDYVFPPLTTEEWDDAWDNMDGKHWGC